MGVVAFHLSWAIASWVQPNYSARREFISALAAPDGQLRWLMTAGFLALGAALTRVGVIAWSQRPTRMAGVLLIVSAVCVVVAAFVRQRCSTALADCGELVTRQSAWSATRIHDAAATAGFVLMLAAAVALTAQMPGRSWRLPVAASFGVITLAMAVAWSAGRGWADAGAVQRAFVLTLSVWLVLSAPRPGASADRVVDLTTSGERLDADPLVLLPSERQIRRSGRNERVTDLRR